MPPPPTSSTSPTEKKSRKKLVPDLSDTIEASGQRLTRVVRAPREASDDTSSVSPASPPPRTLEDVARKHLGPEQMRVLEDNAELFRALQDAENETEEPSLAETIASRVELLTDGSAVIPHPESDPQKREGTMTMSPLVGLDDAPDFFAGGKAHPETIFDLFSLFPQLDGDNWFIYVERKLPKLYAGRKVDGIQRPITAPLTLTEWQYWYGGGTYKLIVYGPSKRAVSMNADGRAPPKALTEAITVTFPGVPSFESEVYDGEDSMTQAAPSGFPNIPLAGRRGPASMADAAIEKERLTVDAAREVRQESRADQERSKAEQALKEKSQGESAILKMFMDSQREAAAREAELRASQVEREREIADERRENDAKWEARIRELIGEKKPDDLERLAKLSTIISKPDNSEAVRENHAREMERAQAAAKDAADRAAERIREAEARADRRIEEEKTRSADRVKEVERRFSDLERDLRERFDRDMQRVKDDSERRIGDMHRQHTDAMAAESRNHERDVKSLTAQHAMANESLKSTYEMRLDTARSENKRTGSEIERWKKEAEDGKDVVGKLRKLKEDAAELGMVPAEEANAPAEPETVPQMLIKMGGGLIQNLPGIIENVGGMFKQRNAQELQAARQAGRAEMIEQASAFGGAARELPPPHSRRRQGPPQLGGGQGYVPRHMSEVSPPPIHPGIDPFTVPPQPHFQPEPLPMVEAQPVAYGPSVFDQGPPPAPSPTPSAPPPQQLQPIASVLPPPAPVQIPPPPSIAPSASIAPAPAAPVAAPPSAELAEDREILQAEQILAPQYAAAVPVAVLAEQMWAQFGAENVTSLVGNIDAERVILAITRSGDPNSPFLRRDGKKYLRALFEELKKKVLGA